MDDKIYKKKCPYCERILSSLSEQQLVYNSKQHIESCKKKQKGGIDGIQKEERS